jgi:hypothetical protein
VSLRPKLVGEDGQKLSTGDYRNMNIISYNPGHDGAIAYLKGAHLLVSIEDD